MTFKLYEKTPPAWFILVALLMVAVVIIAYQASEIHSLRIRSDNLVATMLTTDQERSYWQAESAKNADYFRMEQKKLHLLIDALTPEKIEVYDPEPMQCGWEMCGCLDNPVQDDVQKTICEEAGFNRWYAMQIVCMADDNCTNCMLMGIEGGQTFAEAAAWCYKYALYP